MEKNRSRYFQIFHFTLLFLFLFFFSLPHQHITPAMDSTFPNPFPPQLPSAYRIKFPPPPPPHHHQQQQQQLHFQPLHTNVSGRVPSLSRGQAFYTLESLESDTSLHSAIRTPVQQRYETLHSLVAPRSQETSQVVRSPGLRDAYLSQARLSGVYSGRESASVLVHPGHVYGWTRQPKQELDDGWVQAWSHERTLAEGAHLPRRKQRPRFGRRHKKSRANALSATMAEPGMPSAEKAKGQEKGSGWCPACQLDCSSAETLKQHMAGKKHIRRLEKEDSESTEKQRPKSKTQTGTVVADVQMRGGDKQDIKESTDKKNGADMSTVIADVMGLAEHSQKRKREKNPGWCPVYQLDCSSAEILKQHMAGKKHIRRLEKEDSEAVEKQQPKPKTHNGTVVADVEMSGGDKQDIKESTDKKNGADMSSVLADVMSLAEHSQKRKREKNPVWCPVCQLDCSSSETLKQHMAGKKHIRRLEKEDSKAAEKQPSKPKTQTGTVVADVQMSGGDKQDIKESTDKKNVANMSSVVADLMSLAEHSQKRKREKSHGCKCEICNITCTSKALLDLHFTGKKHAARIRKLNKEDPVSKGDGKIEEKVSTSACVGTDGDGHAGREKEAMDEDNTVVAGESAVNTAEAAGQTVVIAEQVNGTVD